MRHTTFGPDGNVVATEDFPDDPAEKARVTVEDRLRQALDANRTYLALDTPTAAQQRAQVARLTRQNTALIRHLLRDLTDTSDT